MAAFKLKKMLKRAKLENNVNVQKQPPKVLFKKSFSEKFRNIKRKTTGLEPLFHKVVPKERIFLRTSANGCF